MSTAEPMLLTYKYRLNPTRAQHRALERILEQQRQLYNAALDERIDAYAKTGRSPSEVEQSRSLTQIRADDPAFAGVQRRIQRQTLKRLDRAYKAFFKRAKAGAGVSSGFPKFKGREWFDGFSFDAFKQISWDGKRLRFAGMAGGLRVHVDRPLPKVIDPETGEITGPHIRGIWFRREGRIWYCGMQCEAPTRRTRQGLGTGAIGADWGTSMLACLSSGEVIPNPRHGEALAKDVARAQRAVSRKRKGSKRRLKARRHLGAVQRRVANRRRNTMDKLSSRLVRHWQTVAIERIDAKGLMDAERPGEAVPEFVRRRRNREALDAAPYMLRQMLAYKARREGARLLVIDPAGTTQDAWATMGVEPPRSGLGEPLPRKAIAARIILRRALSQADNNGGGPVPGGLDGSDAAAARNGLSGDRRLGNTGAGRPASGRRPAMGLPTTAQTDDPGHRRRREDP